MPTTTRKKLCHRRTHIQLKTKIQLPTPCACRLIAWDHLLKTKIDQIYYLRLKLFDFWDAIIYQSSIDSSVNSPACCFFFRLTAAEMSATRSSSEQPLRIASLNEISVFPNRQTWRMPAWICELVPHRIDGFYLQIAIGSYTQSIAIATEVLCHRCDESNLSDMTVNFVRLRRVVGCIDQWHKIAEFSSYLL